MPTLLIHPDHFPRITTWCLALTATLFIAPGLLQAQQRGVETTTKTGTLVGVEQKGRAQVLKYTDDAGEEQELLVTPKIQVQVEAEGELAFLQEGVFIAALATESNQQLFADEVSVYLFGKGRVPAGKIQKAPPQPGQSVSSYQVTGPIASIGKDNDYPEYQRVEVKAAGPRAPLMLKDDVQVTVKSTDFSMVAAGAPIEIEGVELRNGRFNVMKVTAKLEEPMKASDVLGGGEEGKGAASEEGKGAASEEG